MSFFLNLTMQMWIPSGEKDVSGNAELYYLIYEPQLYGEEAEEFEKQKLINLIALMLCDDPHLCPDVAWIVAEYLIQPTIFCQAYYGGHAGSGMSRIEHLMRMLESESTRDLDLTHRIENKFGLASMGLAPVEHYGRPSEAPGLAALRWERSKKAARMRRKNYRKPVTQRFPNSRQTRRLNRNHRKRVYNKRR